MWTLRDYRPEDETSWLRCRVLGFLDTAYFDDVAVRKPQRDPGLEVVAVAGDQVVGLLDASIDGDQATIETVVVHPDHRRLGIAHALLDEISRRLAVRGVRQIDAWTRDDARTLDWYAGQGFVEEMRYLHVYASTPEEAAFAGREGLLPRSGFFHAWLEQEDELRAEFRRVHVCRRFVRSVSETGVGEDAMHGRLE
ncbi:GCN5-related N-acetyltransferase [Kribbella flavida DSM 17836]|uniref:GCN5-related N-acetyltransferase n=1 Tax=Kribbella flavida (strain DSM 17836 / JCM 10339 / NBRC 14399) TaxID=479435 RepID=D2PZK2_KRIFD|nr:GNAT family N-acetyltransferase [Kribbella flavida]ADB35568.1 GCN5-related N-acetyltransferase [Kribbella flavida DSM 17836]